MKFQSAKDIQETMLSSKYFIRDQFSKMVSVILDFCFFNTKYFSKCKCGCLNMFYHLPFRMRPQKTCIYPKKETNVVKFMICIGILWYDLASICFYLIRFHYIWCVLNEGGQFTWDISNQLCAGVRAFLGVSITQLWPKNLLHNKGYQFTKCTPF